MSLFECLQIVAISIISGLFSEFLSWLLIYRTDEYITLKERIEAGSKKVEDLKAQAPQIDKAGKKGKRLETLETRVKDANQKMAIVKFKSMFFLSFTMIAVFGILNSLFDGKTVARLPFEPIGIITGLSHRNLMGSDMYDCSMLFIYVLSSMGLRGSMQKMLGFAPPKGSNNSFFPAAPSQ